ncbi:MAG: hypothetical protein GY851_19655, partial [bacterium]|nr:hypothetical protein [bacterium]
CRAEKVTHFNGSVANFEQKLEEWRDPDFMREPPVPVEALAGRRVLQLPETWAFKPDPDNAGENEVWFRGPPDASWKPLSIHQVWEEQGYDPYDGYAWYTVAIDVPEIAETTLWLLFEAVDETFELWVNGEPAGKSKGDPALLWDRPVGLDVTGKLKPGQKNRITVRVRDAGLAGGIWKPVWVTASDS